MHFFNLSKEEKKEIMNDSREEYSTWKKQNMELNKPFFQIHTDFETIFLKDISGGALKLYVYLGFRAKYMTGELWESIPTISSFFDKDVRTIANWFEELEEIGLVSRYQVGYKRSANTFLKPYGFNISVYDTLIGSDFETISEHMEENSYIFNKAIMFNYAFTEYTLVLIKEENNIINCQAFPYFESEDIGKIRTFLLKNKIKIDNFDISMPFSTSNNIEQSIYRELLSYYREEVI